MVVKKKLPVKLREKFQIEKWKWYVVDARDLRLPELIRKHFDNKKQAERFIEKYCGKGYDVVTWKEVGELGLKFQPRKQGSKRRDKVSKNPKYEYPPDRITQYQRFLFRKNEQKKMKTDKRRPEVTRAAVLDVVDGKPLFFIKRLKKWKNYHWAFSQPVWGFDKWRDEYDDMRVIVMLSNIVRCLRKHYDLGLYHANEVAEKFYDMYKDQVDKHMKPDPVYSPRLQNVRAEFIARGYKLESEISIDPDRSYVTSIYLGREFIYPEPGWHRDEEKDEFEYYIYDLHAMVGIPGYSRAWISGLDKRK